MAGRIGAVGAVQILALSMALGAWYGPPAQAAVQRRTGAITGRLVDRQSHSPVSGARLALLGTPVGFVSDSEGRFAKDSLRPGDYLLQVRALGYAVAAWPLQLGAGEVLHQDFELEPLPVQLDPVLVERQPRFAEQRRREFEQRRSGGRGYFITEEQIRQASAHILSDLLRNVPGVHIQCRGAAAGCVVRMARAPRDCRPDYFVDAFPATYSTSLDMPTTGIIGVEIYRTLSETPLEFVRGNGQCGTIVIWTRSGPG